ncbi:unnamed protein product [marine sediment metagenome]|uniref:Phage protein Gp37/Gp68 n=1 Tax=marine sediment metagenome TaxID=412755 RepID=X0Z2B5_9ZZZZ
MNKTKIEWTDYTWNPVTGCKHNCEWCYARKIANRFKNLFNDFKPTFHEHRLTEPYGRQYKPSKIFVVSMGDLFGKWVPASWIHSVIKVAEDNPQHTFQFLTKNSKRYLWFDFPKNCWIGTTVTGEKTESSSTYPRRKTIQFLSIEPLLGEPYLGRIGAYDWIIIGAMTGHGSKKHQPKKEWIDKIVEWCGGYNIPIFMKNSLSDIWGRPLIQEFPNE